MQFIDNPLDSLNPFTNLAGYIQDSYQGLMKQFEQIIANTPQGKPGSYIELIYGSAWGLANTLILAITLVLVLSAMFWRRRFKSVFHAVSVAFVLGVGGAIFFPLCDQLYAAGSQLAHLAQFYHPKGQKESVLSTVVDLGTNANPFVLIVGYGFMALLGLILVVIIYGYVVFIIGFKLIFLPALSLSPLGERGMKFLNILISFGLVSLVFGRAMAILWIELSRLAVDTAPLGSSQLGQVILTCFGLILAIVFQGLLLWAGYAGTSVVTGSIMSNIRGMVESFNRQTQKVDGKVAVKSHGAAFRQTQYTSGPSTRHTAVNEATHAVTRKAAKAAGLKVASAVAAGTMTAGTGAVIMGGVSVASGAINGRADDRLKRQSAERAARLNRRER